MILYANICQNSVNAWQIVGIAMLVIRILVPLLIIITAIVPIFNSLIKGTKDETYKSWQLIAKKVAAGIIIFFVPTFFAASINLLTGSSNGDDIFICTSCFNEPNGEACLYHINLYKQLEAGEAQTFKTDSIKGEVKSSDLDKADSSISGSYSTSSSNTNSATVENLLKEARKVTDYARENNFNYGNAPINPAINHEAKLVSCDRCVGWFLYNVGYTDQPYQSGLGLGALQNYLDSHGFTKFTDVNQVQAGDIIFVNPNASGNPGHVYLLGNNVGNGIWERYDCGSVYRIRLTSSYSSYSSQPFHEPIGNFIYAYRMPGV